MKYDMQHLSDVELQEYADKYSTNNSHHQPNQHLSVCGVCSERLNVIKSLSHSIKRIGLEHVSPDFTSRVIQKIGIKEAPSFIWKVLTNLAPLLLLTTVLIIIVSALHLSGASNNPEITNAVQTTRSAYHSFIKEIAAASSYLNNLIGKFFPFSFASKGVSLTIFLLCFLSAIALLDKHVFSHLVKRKRVI